ncbi:MAG: RHS repeat-associated core domain-containing protein, partial [Brumimicrobium sp.]
FGQKMAGRIFSSTDYDYGFQGQLEDDEIKGEGNSINYKYRMHDPRIGRFFAVDPLTAKYPHYSPYSFSGNKVIHAIELEGLEEFKISDKIAETSSGSTAIKTLTVTDVSAPFRILDENDEEIPNFKYECLQMQMCGFIFKANDSDLNGNMGPSLETPNKPGQKMFREVFDSKFSNFAITTGDFTLVEPVLKNKPNYQDFFEVVEGGMNSKNFTAPESSTNVSYNLAWTYMEQGFFEGISAQVVGSDGTVLANGSEGSLDFTVQSGEQFTINVNRGESTLDSEFRFYGVGTTTEEKEVTNTNCEEFECGN